MQFKIARVLILATAACTLAACGGGGGSGLGSTPTPVITPPPPPPPLTKQIIFPAVTATTDFAVLGYDLQYAGTQPLVTGDGFSVRYDAGEQVYIMDVPVTVPGRIEGFSENADSWGGDLKTSYGRTVGFGILKPKSSNPNSVFEFTSLASYYDYEFGYGVFIGAMAFGTATPSAGVPTSGSAVYDALLSGFASDLSEDVGGTASLQFDFGAGTLAGSLSPTLHGASLGTYTFVNTVFSRGSTTFSGSLQRSGLADLGSFNGLFTGPAAEELIARWRAPYINPDSKNQSEIAGVLIGQRP